MNKPTLPPGEPQTAFASESRRKYINKTTGQPENHDRTWAGAIDLPGGGRAWAAIVADGCGGDSRGTQVAESCVAAFRAAVAGSSAAELSDLARARAWVARWGDALQATVVGGPLKGGNSTLAAAVAVRDPAAPGTLSLLLANIGDSPMFLYSGPGLHALNVTPDEPEDNPNAGAGGNGLRRAIGLPAAGGFPLMDVAIRRLPPEDGPYGLAVCSDGVTDYSKVATQGGVRTIKKLKLLNASGFRRILASGMPFASRPAAILAESLAVARKRGVAETQMDNSSVALLGIGLENGVRLPDSPSATASPSRPRRQFPLVPVAAATALLVVAGVLAAVLWPEKKPPEPDLGPGPYMPRKPRASAVATNETASTASVTNAAPANAAPANAAPANAAPTNAAPTNAATSREAGSVPGASAPGPIPAPAPTPPATAAQEGGSGAPEPSPANGKAEPFRGKPVPYKSKDKENEPATKVPETAPPPPEKPAPQPNPEDEWKEAEKTLEACLGSSREKCLAEMRCRLNLHPDWTNRLDEYYAAQGLVPEVRFTNRSKTALSVRIGEGQKTVLEIPGGGEKAYRLKSARFPESGSFSYRVVPAGQCEGCWNLAPEEKVDWSWDSGEIEVSLKAPTPKDNPVWTPKLPDLPPDSWRLERKEGDRWVVVDIPKDGRIELDPHSDAEFRFDLGDRTQVWIVHAGHCGEAVKAENKGVAMKPKFPSVRIENRGPRAIVLNHSGKGEQIPPFSHVDVPVLDQCFSNKVAFTYKIVDRIENTTTTGSIRPETIMLERGDNLKIKTYEPAPSANTEKYLTPDNVEYSVKPLFENLKKYLDAGKGKESNVRDILEGKGSYKKIANDLLAPENATGNVYAFLRWFYPVARERFPEAGWPEMADDDWKKLEDIWKQMHPVPVEPARPAASESAPSPAPAPPEEQKPSGKEDDWTEYTIKEGDKLWKLAENLLPKGSSKERIDQLVSDIRARNKIEDPDKIKSGQKILLPPKK